MLTCVSFMAWNRAVLPTGVFLCQIFELGHILEVVGIHFFGLAYFSTTNFFDICKMLNQILSEISSTFVIGKTRETLQSCVRRGLCVRQR